MKAMKEGKIQESLPDTLQLASKSAKSLWERRKNLRIRGDCLYLLTSSNNYAWVVPKSERKRLICSAHKGSGHIGITKCVSLIKEKYYWPDMESDIRTVINTCIPC